MCSLAVFFTRLKNLYTDLLLSAEILFEYENKEMRKRRTIKIKRDLWSKLSNTNLDVWKSASSWEKAEKIIDAAFYSHFLCEMIMIYDPGKYQRSLTGFSCIEILRNFEYEFDSGGPWRVPWLP